MWQKCGHGGSHFLCQKHGIDQVPRGRDRPNSIKTCCEKNLVARKILWRENSCGEEAIDLLTSQPRGDIFSIHWSS